MKKDLVQDMAQEEKKKVVFEDFGFKPALTGDESRKKEAMIIESLKRGELAAEIINGELKL